MAQPALAGCRVGAVPDAEPAGETPALATTLGAPLEPPFCVEPVLPTISAVLPALAPAPPLTPALPLAPAPPDDEPEPLEASGTSLDGLLASSTAASPPSFEEPASGGAVPASMAFVARPVAPQKMRSCIVAELVTSTLVSVRLESVEIATPVTVCTGLSTCWSPAVHLCMPEIRLKKIGGFVGSGCPVPQSGSMKLVVEGCPLA
jgi:hypothetical protein